MKKKIEIRQLQNLAILAKTGNFHRAADQLCISQPALTKNIRKLEEQLDVLLFDRAPDQIRPTEHCLVLLEHAEKIFDELDQAGDRLAELVGRPMGRIHIGCGPIIGAWGLREVLVETHAKYPDVRFTVRFDDSGALASQLRSRQLHVMIADTEVLENDRDVQLDALPAEEFIVVCNASHPLMGKGSVNGHDLLKYKVALPNTLPRSYAYFAQCMPDGWAVEDFVDQIVGMQCDNYRLMLDLVASTSYLSVGIRSLFQDYFDRGEMVPLTLQVEQPLFSRPGIVTLKQRTLPDAVSFFCEALKARAEILVRNAQ